MVNLGVETIIPPGNIHHFKFAVEHVDEILNVPMTDREKTILEEKLEEVKTYPFF